MSLGDIVSRTDLILRKYEKYAAKPDGPADRPQATGADKFTDEYVLALQKIEELSTCAAQRAQEVGEEKNRAVRAALNAELRRGKAALVDGNLATLNKLVRKGKADADVLEDRLRKVDEVRAAIEAIPDGVHGRAQLSPSKLRPGGEAGPSKGPINIEARAYGDGHFTSTAESSKFRQEFELAKVRQDRQLEGIERGLGTLREVGLAMGEALDHQDVLVDAITEKVDDVTKQLKTNNMKLKGLVTQIRPARNFCIDVILICILLAIGLFIFDLFHKL